MAVTTEKGITQRIVNVIAVQMIGQETGLIQVLRTPKSISLDTGIKTKTTEGVDPLGRKALVDRTVTDYMPTIDITYDGASLDFFRLSMGRRIEKITGDIIYLPIRRQALKASYPPIAIGGLGYEIVANPPSRASAKFSGGLSVQLVQQPSFTAFVPTTILSYAIDAAGAIKFSDDLVNARAIVEMSIQATIDTQSMSERDLDFQAVRAIFRNSDETVTLLDIPTIQINPEGSKFDTGGDSTQVKGSILSLGGCEPFTIKTLSSRLTCQN
jgi:hypothetical protein